MFRAFLSRTFPRWQGNHIALHEVIGGDTQARLLVPWGFLGPDVVQAKVAPRISRLIAGAGGEGKEKEKNSQPSYHHHPHLGNQHSNEECKELFAELKSDFAMGVPQAYLRVVEIFLHHQQKETGGEVSAAAAAASSSFKNHNYCSPDLSSFLDDCKQNNADWGLQPLLSVSSVEAKLCSLRFERGFLCKNKYIGGLMSNQEAMMHVLEGVVGPEGQLLQEIEGNMPRRLVAEVEVSVVETFQFFDPMTKETMVWPPPPSPPVEGEAMKEGAVEGGGDNKRTHFFTFETDWHGQSVEWVITNINDVIVTPSLTAAQELS